MVRKGVFPLSITDFFSSLTGGQIAGWGLASLLLLLSLIQISPLKFNPWDRIPFHRSISSSEGMPPQKMAEKGHWVPRAPLKRPMGDTASRMNRRQRLWALTCPSR